MYKCIYLYKSNITISALKLKINEHAVPFQASIHAQSKLVQQADRLWYLVFNNPF